MRLYMYARIVHPCIGKRWVDDKFEARFGARHEGEGLPHRKEYASHP